MFKFNHKLNIKWILESKSRKIQYFASIKNLNDFFFAIFVGFVKEILMSLLVN